MSRLNDTEESTVDTQVAFALLEIKYELIKLVTHKKPDAEIIQDIKDFINK